VEELRVCDVLCCRAVIFTRMCAVCFSVECEANSEVLRMLSQFADYVLVVVGRFSPLCMPFLALGMSPALQRIRLRNTNHMSKLPQTFLDGALIPMQAITLHEWGDDCVELLYCIISSMHIQRYICI
jgi:hypothetical protein